MAAFGSIFRQNEHGGSLGGGGGAGVTEALPSPICQCEQDEYRRRLEETHFLFLCFWLKLVQGLLAVFSLGERDHAVFTVVRPVCQARFTNDLMGSDAHPQFSHIESPGIVLGARHHTVDILVEHAAH